MKVKVCGITKKEDLRAMNLFQQPADFVGFIFYPDSKRYVGDSIADLAATTICVNTARVGVFVNGNSEMVREICSKHQLDFAQLHGSESPDDCAAVRKSVKVIKAFNVDETFDFKQLKAYNETCDYFLFDAKGEYAGGNGIAYDWNLLKRYEMDKPFFLSGGIKPEYAEQLLSFHHPALFAIDINSGFETAPGKRM